MNSLRFALRSLRKTPGFTVIALVTLALGIGLNTAMFSLVDALLFRSGPFPHAGRLMEIVGSTRQGPFRQYSQTEFLELKAQAQSFESLTEFTQTAYAAAEPGRTTERLSSIAASPDIFTTFGVQPVLGRAFTAEEGEPGKNSVAVVSYAFWQQRYGGSNDVIGRTVRLDGVLVTIIGVMPDSFSYPMLWGNVVLWRPINFTKDQQTIRAYRILNAVGRLKDGRSGSQATAELAAVASQQEKDHPHDYAGLGYRAIPLNQALMDDLGRKISWMLLGLSGFVLLIACANLANLQLARATDRARELAIRTALGASRARLVGEQLVECLVLSLAGGGLGIIVALWVNSTLERNIMIDGAPGLSIQIDSSILALTILLALGTGIFFGLMPAWLASRTDINHTLKQQGRGSSTGRAHHRMRHALIVGEVALALILLAGAGIMQRGFVRMLERNPGWDTDRVLTATLQIPEARFDSEAKRNEFHRRLEARLATLPGVEHVALSTSVPLWSYSNTQAILVEGQPAGDPSQLPIAYHTMVTPDYFATMGIPLLSGHTFAPDLTFGSPQVVIINEAMARQFWPKESALGKRIAVSSDGKPVWREVVGVVRDAEGVASFSNPETRFQVYRPLVQEPWAWTYLILRTPQPLSLVEPLHRAVAEVDADLPADNVATVRQFADRQLHNLIVVGHTLTAFALLGLLLAGIGLYGVISNLVAQRTGEFGIRLALGASTSNVLQLVLGQGVRLALIGLGLGLVGAYGLGRMLGAMMPRIASPDPLAIAAVGLLLFGVALFACWLPARRVTKVDPLVALRNE